MWFLTLAACGGASPETLVDELRVMAIVPAEPEVAPGGMTAVTVEVLDPTGAGGTAWVWACAPIGEACLEAPAVTAIDLGGPAVATITVPGALSAVAGPTPIPLLPIWALAAAPGEEPPAGWTDDPANLANPTAMMADLALHGTSLAVWPLSVSTRDDVHENPGIAVTPAPATDGSVAFSVTVDGDPPVDGEAFGYATTGGFTKTSASLATGSASLTWLPGDSPAADVLIVVNDGEGGVATWSGAAP